MLISHILKTEKSYLSKISLPKNSQKIQKLRENRILLVGMVDSPHFQGWVSKLRTEYPELKMYIFPSDRPRFKTQSADVNKTKKIPKQVFHILPSKTFNFVTYFICDQLFGLKWRAYLLGKIILFYKPVIIHFHEMQHGAYIYNLISNYRKIPKNIKKVVSTWGSDLTLYSWVDSEIEHIKNTLSWTDLLTAEKYSEKTDALRLGFEGSFIAPVYISVLERKPLIVPAPLPSHRKSILVKGYQDNPGRSLNALRAIAGIQKKLQDYEVKIFSASTAVVIQADIMRNRDGMNIKIIKKVSKLEMQNEFSQACLYIGLACSDGLPGALVEAMQYGCFPIQSSNSAASEFIENGVNGFLVDPWDLQKIQDSILSAIENANLIDNAAILNKEILNQKLSEENWCASAQRIYFE